MDAYETRKKDWEDLEVTKEELKNLNECLKKEEFRKLLIQYAEEVTDPENRKTYEKEITQLEKERGVDVTFVNPEPGYVIKTSVNGDKKCFLNISKSDIVGRPSSQPFLEQGHGGLEWSIPYTLIPTRDDLDKKNMRCMVFDVVFHPDTIYMASKNARFREIVNNTALDGVESNFKVKLDRKNLKFPKMGYKGISRPAVIRKPSEDPPKQQLDIEPEIYQKLISSYDESRERQWKITSKKKAKRAPPPTTYYKDKPVEPKDTEMEYVTPKFFIKHQTDIDLQDFGVSKDAKMHAAMPKKLIVTINLPLLRNAKDASLDIQDRSLALKSEKPAKYLLELPLPYCVDADSGNAKFDQKRKKLTVTLPVVRPTAILTKSTSDKDVDDERDSVVPQLSHETIPDSSTTNHTSDSMPKSVEEPREIALAATVLEKKSELIEECSDTALRTISVENAETFMNPSIKYSLPAFTCNIYDNQLAVTVNVKNVIPCSIRHRILRDNLGVHILLKSLGAGFFVQYYSLCFKIAEDSIDPDTFTIEPWDNNVVFTITLKNTENLARYYVGLNDEFMEERDFPTAASFKNQLRELMASEDTESDKNRKMNVQVRDNDDGDVVINIQSSQSDSDDEVELRPPEPEITSQKKNRRHSVPKSRSLSESSGDELSGRAGSFSKGILKARRADFSRSMSESNADEAVLCASSVDFHYDSAQDLNSYDSSLKKTVRFNDAVSIQLFRSDSSILGQQKKNQRKLRTRMRNHIRSMSESANSDSEACLNACKKVD